MIAMLRALNWLGVLAGALALWAVRLAHARMVVRSDRETRTDTSGTAVRPRWGIESGYFLFCVLVATGISLTQAALEQTLVGAIGLGFLLAVIPASLLIGADPASPRTHGTVSAVTLMLGLIACSVVVHFLRW